MLLEARRLRVKKISVTILLLALLLPACANKTTTGNLVCELSSKDKQVCSSVLSLESGVLRLNDNSKQFQLEAHYDACFQSTDVRVTGEFKQHPHKSVFDLELLANKAELKGGSIDRFSRTIGLLTLNNKSLKGHFVDIWAMIRTHTQKVENLPNIDVSCRREK